MAKGMQTRQGLVGQELHNRMTRGETLTDAERTALQAWYGAQDALESTLLQVAPPTTPDALRADVDAALVRLKKMTQDLQRLSKENATLRSENAMLTRRLAQTTQGVA